MNKRFKIYLIIFIVLVLLIVGKVFFSKKVGENEIIKTQQPAASISEAEEQSIGEWIKNNDLNRYGDPKEMMYTGGTPLFNEKIGQGIDRYEYILKNYPDKPWLK